jgi:polar amino acid transport system substrate-binding protein
LTLAQQFIPMKQNPLQPTSFLHALTLLLRGIVVVLLMAACSGLAQQTVSLRADNWYPLNGNPADAKPGYVIEILKAVFEKDGGKVDYSIMPWKRAVGEVEKGAVDGVIGALKSDTPEFIFPEEPIGISENACFVKKGSPWTYSSLESLKDHRLGIVNGYSYSDKLDEYIKQNQGNARLIDESSGDNADEQAIRKLQAGRIDTFVEVRMVFWAQVTRLGLKTEDFAEAGLVSQAEPLYVSFSPKRPEARALAARLTAGIREMRASGELAKILAKYGVKDWAK